MEPHLDDNQIDLLLGSTLREGNDTRFLETALDEILAHLEACEICRLRVKTLEARTPWLTLLRRDSTTISGPNCPSDDQWIEIAAGATTQDSDVYLTHAANCDHCGPLLRQASLLLAAEVTPEEDSMISNLPSSTPTWQRMLAKRLSRLRPVESTEEPRKGKSPTWDMLLGSPLRLALTLFVVGFVSLGSWVMWHRLQREPVEQSIAHAYTQNRTLAFRFPGAHYGPMKAVTRGEEPSHADRPLPLLEAETWIALQAERGNKDKRWMLASAYAALLDGDYEHAVQILEPEAKANPSIPEIDIAIATAYFERGSHDHIPDDLGKALEAIGRALDKEPNSPIALFNRSLIEEGMGLNNQAISGWQQYLQVDPDGEWSKEAREHLSRCQQIKDGKANATSSQSLLSPEAVSGIGALKATDDQIDQRIEDYQLRVFTSYYPILATVRRPADVQRDSIEELAIRRIGQISAARHDDHLVLDLIASTASSSTKAPTFQLSAAIEANRAGNEQLALNLAQKADSSFRRLGNLAGSLRSRFEIVYAMQFMSRTRECISSSRELAARARESRYSWLTAQAEIQEAFCSDMNGDLAEATKSLNLAKRDAVHARYEIVLERVLVGEAGMEWQAGSITTAWNLALDGLKQFWTSSVPYERGESFCDEMDEMAEQEHEWHLQSVILGESLTLLDQEQDRLAQAQVKVRLAASELMLNRSKEANDQLMSALRIFRAAPQTAATKDQELMVLINLAKAQEASHNYAASAAQLEELRPQLPQLHEDLSLIEFHTGLGDAYRRLGNYQKAEESDLAAIKIFRGGLSNLARVRDRLTWLRQVSPAFRSLVQLRIDQNRSSDALRLWQDYRSARISPNWTMASPLDGASSQVEQTEPKTTLVYANLPNGPFAWAISGRSIRSIPLRVSYEDLNQLAGKFADECSSPTSDMGDLQTRANQLYNLLVEPFAALLPEDGAILIEPDDEFAKIPFNALVDGRGRYLNATHTIAISPFGGELSGPIFSRRPPIRRDPALLVESRFSGRRGRVDLQSIDEIKTVASFFPNNTTVNAGFMARGVFRRSLENAAIFHYAGHSATSGNGGALILNEETPTGPEGYVPLRPDDLEGTRLKRGKLAVLSACRTDRGQGDHWLDRDNFAVTLLSAGIPEVVATRWSIDSGATTVLMKTFYTGLSKGKPVPTSLRVAMEQTRQIPQYRHPFFWAAFSVLERLGPG